MVALTIKGCMDFNISVDRHRLAQHCSLKTTLCTQAGLVVTTNTSTNITKLNAKDLTSGFPGNIWYTYNVYLKSNTSEPVHLQINIITTVILRPYN